VLADLARGKLRKKLVELRQALVGRLEPHHRVLIERLLTHIDVLNESLLQLDEQIEHHLAPFEATVRLLDTIPGVGRTAAATIIAEIGVDMSRWPTRADRALSRQPAQAARLRGDAHPNRGRLSTPALRPGHFRTIFVRSELEPT